MNIIDEKRRKRALFILRDKWKREEIARGVPYCRFCKCFIEKGHWKRHLKSLSHLKNKRKNG